MKLENRLYPATLQEDEPRRGNGKPTQKVPEIGTAFASKILTIVLLSNIGLGLIVMCISVYLSEISIWLVSVFFANVLLSTAVYYGAKAFGVLVDNSTKIVNCIEFFNRQSYDETKDDSHR